MLWLVESMERGVESLEMNPGAERVHFNLSVCTQALEQQHYLAIGLLMPNFQLQVGVRLLRISSPLELFTLHNDST